MSEGVFVEGAEVPGHLRLMAGLHWRLAGRLGRFLARAGERG